MLKISVDVNLDSSPSQKVYPKTNLGGRKDVILH